VLEYGEYILPALALTAAGGTMQTVLPSILGGLGLLLPQFSPFERNDEGEANVLTGIGEGGKYGYCCNKDKSSELV
jgi:hypothetical protein